MTARPARPPATTSATRTGAINDGNWASATQVTGEPTPAAAGTNQSMVVSGLSAGTTYYFAIKTSDEMPNTSAISNSPSGTTTSSGGITPPGRSIPPRRAPGRRFTETMDTSSSAFTGTPGSGGTDAASLPGYISNYSTNLTRWLWAVNTSDAYDLQQPSGSIRNIGCLYTAAAGTITLVPSQTKDFTLRLYLRDYESYGRWDNLSFTGAGLTGTDVDRMHGGQVGFLPGPCHGGHERRDQPGVAAGVNSAVISAILFDSTPVQTRPPRRRSATWPPAVRPAAASR